MAEVIVVVGPCGVFCWSLAALPTVPLASLHQCLAVAEAKLGHFFTVSSLFALYHHFLHSSVSSGPIGHEGEGGAGERNRKGTKGIGHTGRAMEQESQEDKYEPCDKK